MGVGERGEWGDGAGENRKAKREDESASSVMMCGEIIHRLS